MIGEAVVTAAVERSAVMKTRGSYKDA